MHICFITSEYPKKGFPHGGVGSFIQTMAYELVKNNMSVSIVGLNYENYYQEECIHKINIFRLKPSNVKSLKWFFNSNNINSKIKEIHSKNPIDVIETPELGLAFLKKSKDITYLIRLHGGHHFLAVNGKTHWWKSLQEKLSFRKADAFIAISKHIETQTEQLLGFFNKPVVQIYNPIDLNNFIPNFNTDITAFQIIFVGTVYEKKGIIQLLRAFKIVKNKIPAATLEIYGKDWFFKDSSSFIEKLKKEEINDAHLTSINFNGAVPHSEIAQKYAQANICVFPSLFEAQGLVVIEAMAMEKLVIFTEFGPGKELIENLKTGILCNPYDPEDIAVKILWSLQNQEKIITIGKNARKMVATKFDIEKIVHENIAFYKHITS